MLFASIWFLMCIWMETSNKTFGSTFFKMDWSHGGSICIIAVNNQVDFKWTHLYLRWNPSVGRRTSTWLNILDRTCFSFLSPNLLPCRWKIPICTSSSHILQLHRIFKMENKCMHFIWRVCLLIATDSVPFNLNFFTTKLKYNALSFIKTKLPFFVSKELTYATSSLFMSARMKFCHVCSELLP